VPLLRQDEEAPGPLDRIGGPGRDRLGVLLPGVRGPLEHADQPLPRSGVAQDPEEVDQLCVHVVVYLQQARAVGHGQGDVGRAAEEVDENAVCLRRREKGDYFACQPGLAAGVLEQRLHVFLSLLL
jgi:hypothetical protein